MLMSATGLSESVVITVEGTEGRLVLAALGVQVNDRRLILLLLRTVRRNLGHGAAAGLLR